MIGEGFPMTLIRWTLGALFIDEFFVNLHDRNYTSAGYVRLIDRYLNAAASPAAWKAVERFVVHHAAVFSVVQAVGEISLGVALTVGLLRPVAAAGAAALLVGLAVSELGLGWVWEFPPIIIGAIAVLLATAPAFAEATSMAQRVLGPRVLTPCLGLIAAIAGGALLALTTHAHGDPQSEVWRAALVFGLALLVSACLDRWRQPPVRLVPEPHANSPETSIKSV